MASFPRKESLLNNYFIVVLAYILSNFARLGVSVANKATLISCMATWNTIYPLASTAATSTTANVKDKNIAKAAVKAILRLIFGDIIQSVLTSTDRLTLLIPVVGGNHGEVPIPDSVPNGTVDDSYRLAHKISYTDSASGKKAKPHGAGGVEIWQKIGGVAPVSVSDLILLETVTKTPFVVGFEGTQAGSKVWYWMRWTNKTSKGNWGPEFNGTIMP